MAVGVLTFHRCINYGSYWQAKCLVEGLRAKGADAVLLDHRSRRVDWAEWRCAFRPLLPMPTRPEDYPLYGAKIRTFLDAFSKLPLSAPFELERPDDMEPYALVIVGSDEVWNLNHPWYAGARLFWGEGLNAGRIISYAASCGNFAPDSLDPWWAEKLRNFSNISVRDSQARRLVRDALGIDPTFVLDPCLQFPEIIEAAGVEGVETPYLAVYGHTFPSWFQQSVRRWADAKGLRLVSIGYRNDWADAQWIEAGPDDFARFIAGAEAVATNFFHGCVFSLVNTKPFACALSDYRSHKVRDLMATVGAEGRLMTETASRAQYAAALSQPVEPSVTDRIATLRRTSNLYLDHVLRHISPAAPDRQAAGAA